MNKQKESQIVSQAEKEQMIIHQAQNSLIDFSIAVDYKYQDTWFHELILTILEDAIRKVENGEDVRIILTMPPRHGKTEAGTKKLPAFALGKHPDWEIAVASYSSELASDFGQDTRDIMQSPQYQSIFKTRLRQDAKAKGKWMTQSGGGYVAVGAGGSLTGRGFKIGVIDDLFKNREEAESKTIRDSRWDWYRSTFYTRQEGHSAMICIGTRWHEDDVIGRLLAEEERNRLEGSPYYDKWNLIEFPAIAIHDEKYRDKGESLWPEKFPIEKLRTIEEALGPYDWSALYQSNPITSANQEFKTEWIKHRSWSQVEVLNTRKFATIDPGGKEIENDYTGITRNYIDQENNWNIKSMRVHIDAIELINLVFMLDEEGFEEIGIEETVYLKAIEPFFILECKKRNRFPKVTPLKAAGRNKEVRIRGLIPRYATGSVFHIDNECADLEAEMVVFPKGAHDDTCDSLAYMNDIAKPPMNIYLQAQRIEHRKEKAAKVAKMYGLG